LQGSVERITFHSEENGFCVVRVKVKGQKDFITVIGNAASISLGEYLECKGQWINDKKHGLQFKAQQLKVILPTSLDGIEKYLGSGMVKGIGPHFAKKLVKAFGNQVFEIIEQTPHRLMELDGIGDKRKQCVISAWTEQKSIRTIMVFLQTYGVGSARAVRIYKTYGDEAIERVRENPYRLAHDIYGIGFKTADTLAERLGIARDSLLRAQAGVNYVLQTLCDKGHCGSSYAQLIQTSVALLEISEPIIVKAIEEETITENLITDTIDATHCVFPAALYRAEQGAANHLQRLLQGIPPWGQVAWDKAIPWVEQKTGLQLSLSQKQAITTVLQHKVSIITGGPGVGKTTLIKSLLTLLEAKKLLIALAAPTGRAAKRLTETTGLTAKTLHRLLEYDPQTFEFKHNQDNPLHLDVLVIDEASMLDIVLLNQVLKAIPPRAAILFVGDVDQLPSVGSGAVLSDMIASGHIPTVRLTEIFRQAADSHIIINAHRVNQGQMPLPNVSVGSDFYTVYADTPEAIHEQLIPLVCERIPRYLTCNPVKDIQVLTPMNRGGLGSLALNSALQKQLNGHSTPTITRFGWTFAPGDKVIQRVNNYDKDVFNGDIGWIELINEAESEVTINFDNRPVIYDFHELDEIHLAYAISIHKSQGSEFPVVVIPLATQHYNLLARNLLYTAITRGKQLVVLIGQKKAIGMAIKNNRAAQRLTKLADWLKR
jgi:exodeoxyribonuclease V alpha subunit